MLAFTEILRSQISDMKTDITPIGRGGLGSPDDEIHRCHSETSYPTMLLSFAEVPRGRKNEGEEGRKGKGTSARCQTLAFLKPGVP